MDRYKNRKKILNEYKTLTTDLGSSGASMRLAQLVWERTKKKD